MSSISLLHATRGRPKLAVTARSSWFDRAANPERVEHIFAIDADDRDSDGLKRFPHVIQTNIEGASVGAWNLAAQASTGTILVQLNDDFTPPMGWDKLVSDAFADTTEPAALRVSDGHRTDDLLCIAVINLARYKQQGYFLHPSFKSVYSDNYHSWCSYRDGVVIDARNVVIQHNHPYFKAGKWDATYAAQNSKERYAEGKKIFEELTQSKSMKISVCEQKRERVPKLLEMTTGSAPKSGVILAFTCADRPQYLEPTLVSWLNTDLSLVSSIHFFIEPTDKRGECVAIIDEFAKNSVTPVIKHYNNERLGVMRNPWHLFDHCFRIEAAEFVILGEDDFLVSPDTLDFLINTRTNWNGQTLAACAKWDGERSDSNPATFHRTIGFTGNVWITSAGSWNRHLRDTWDFDKSSGSKGRSGWDWNIHLRIVPKRNLHCIVPTASRSRHIGITGTHCRPRSFKRTVTWNFLEDHYKGAYSEVVFQSQQTHTHGEEQSRVYRLKMSSL